MTFDPNASNGPEQDHCSTNTPIGNGVPTIVPRLGRLVALRTKAEVDHDVVQTISAYVIKVPQKSANEVLKYVIKLPGTSHFSLRSSELTGMTDLLIL